MMNVTRASCPPTNRKAAGIDAYTAIMRAMADRQRLLALTLLPAETADPMPVAELARCMHLPYAQTIHHLRALRRVRLVVLATAGFGRHSRHVHSADCHRSEYVSGEGDRLRIEVPGCPPIWIGLYLT